MSEFKSKSFDFFSYDYSNPAHILLARRLIADPTINEYIKNIEAFIYEDTGIPLNNAYLVGHNDDLVGYINLYEKRGIVDMDYAVDSTFRGIRNASGETIGSQIIRETAETIFDSYEFVKFIRLTIAASNIRSIKAAERAGFKLKDHFFEGNEYQLHRKK